MARCSHLVCVATLKTKPKDFSQYFVQKQQFFSHKPYNNGNLGSLTFPRANNVAVKRSMSTKAMKAMCHSVRSLKLNFDKWKVNAPTIQELSEASDRVQKLELDILAGFDPATDIESLKAEILKLKDILATLQNDNEQLKEYVASLQNDNASLQNDNGQL
jgi:hypothetical protein